MGDRRKDTDHLPALLSVPRRLQQPLFPPAPQQHLHHNIHGLILVNHGKMFVFRRNILVTEIHLLRHIVLAGKFRHFQELSRQDSEIIGFLIRQKGLLLCKGTDLQILELTCEISAECLYIGFVLITDDNVFFFQTVTSRNSVESKQSRYRR